MIAPERWREVEALYQAVVDRPATERARLLEKADPELRREVESLLAQPSENGALDRPAWGGADGNLRIGSMLGPYCIEAEIGAGGMGRVYKARDTRIGRSVGIKVASTGFSERFQREAQAISALNHPNICTLYDVGPNYLVMELVEGPTLAERIRKRPIPLADALSIARQIADALDAAHEKGIVHRDLKPANIKVKPDGVVKVLDFGLAKTALAESVPDAPTIRPTEAGTILGTAGYMAPEQARGEPVDKRADIWAFGVVLFEMLAGEALFRGKSTADILAAVIREEPDLTRVPAQVQRLVHSCLVKDPKRRLQAIEDWRWLLDESAPAMAVRRGAARWVWPAAAALATLALGFSLWALWRATRQVDRPLVRLDVDLGSDVSLPIDNVSPLAISPDGMRLVYASGTPTKLFTRRLDQSKATELPGTQGASKPFFSPDGQWIGFTFGNRLNKIRVEGGAVVFLGDAGSFGIQNGGSTYGGASWGEDGRIVVGQVYAKDGFLGFSAAGGPPETLAEVGKGEIAFALPQILPGGKAVLFQTGPSQDIQQHTVEVLTFADRRRKIVARGVASAHYLPTSGSGGSGHLIYLNKSTLFAVPFDLDKLATRGTAVPVLNDVAYQPGSWSGQFAVSPGPSGHGTLVYRRAGEGSSPMMQIQWTDAAGKREPLRARLGNYYTPSVSPDGKRVAVALIEVGNPDIWVYDTQRDAMARLTFGGGVFVNPLWTPDGKHVVFSSYNIGLFQARADGAGQPQPLTQTRATQIPWSFTPDGKRLAYFENGKIWTLPVDEQSGQLKADKPEQFIRSTSDDEAPSFSPDGRRLAYQSNESGRDEVYVRTFAPSPSGQAGRWQISNGGGETPRWSRTGHDLLYRSGDQMMAASYTVQGDTFVAEKPRVWLARLGGTNWDLAPDGKRVVVLTPAQAPQAPRPEHEIVFVQNFFDYLRQRLPASE